MEAINRLASLLPGESAKALMRHREDLSEVRLRANRPVQLRYAGGEWVSEGVISPDTLRQVLSSLMDHSRYAREEELRQGFFTLEDGSRAGVCGRLVWDGDRPVGMADIASVCLRVSRQRQGCADELFYRIFAGGAVRSMLIISPPGMGKTTMLRDIARRLSEDGKNVCVADERRELAACFRGVPTLDVGPRTDVMDGCPKAVAIPRMLRASSPEVIVADEIGGPGDSEALADAARCGVAVVTSAHALDFDTLSQRPGLRTVIESGIFDIFALLGPVPGQIREIREGWHAVCAGAVHRGGLRALRKRPGPRPEAAG